ncbi:MAG: redox-sensing transcriptional repressor Rex [candidate division KSB1 bacterium]|nr:redox-sensing transcriptional repressor Rex [candidate division KSB1 bacterium]
MNNQDRISRLLLYKNVLVQFQAIGLVKVFSDNIGDALNISSSLVRKDFAFFKITGSPKGGYDIESILQRIDTILGKDKTQRVILIGIGRLGSALLYHHKAFNREGINITAGFDIDPEKLNPDKPIPIFPVDQLSEHIEKHKIKFAIVTVPESAARHIIDVLKAEQINGILNFTSLKAKNTDTTLIHNVNIEHELLRLVYTAGKRI